MSSIEGIRVHPFSLHSWLFLSFRKDIGFGVSICGGFNVFLCLFLFLFFSFFLPLLLTFFFSFSICLALHLVWEICSVLLVISF